MYWILRLVISHTRQGVPFVTGIGYCRGTSFYGYWVLRLVISQRQGVRDRRYDLLRTSGSASCDITHETGGTICCGHWDLRLVLSYTRQGLRFVTGIGFCVL